MLAFPNFILLIILQQDLKQMINQKRPQQKYRKYSAIQSQKVTTLASTNHQCQFNEQEKAFRKGSTDCSSSLINYKTQVCKYWEMGNNCPFGSTCIFAHGQLEIRNKDGISDKYKTRLCKNFHQNFYCAYGQRCQFIHNKMQKHKIKLKLIKEWFQQDPQILQLFDRQSIVEIKKNHKKSDSSGKKSRPNQSNKINDKSLILNPQPSHSSSSSQYHIQLQMQSFPQEFPMQYQKPRLYSL